MNMPTEDLDFSQMFTSEKRLRVEKSRQPDNAGQRQVLRPAVQLFTTLQHIIIPDTQKRRHILNVLHTGAFIHMYSIETHHMDML